MIIVVEGISAAGKTTWCRSHAKPYLIPETFPDDRKAQPDTGQGTAQYWTDWNVKRWREALAIERAKGHAVCDTDPLKLHYSWSLFQVGELPKSQWQLQSQASRQAICERRLGFVDAYFVKIIDPITARQQSDADPSRVRDRFDLHVRLQPSLIRWYTLLNEVIGGRVHWELPDGGLPLNILPPNRIRYDVAAFDSFVSLLETSAA